MKINFSVLVFAILLLTSCVSQEVNTTRVASDNTDMKPAFPIEISRKPVVGDRFTYDKYAKGIISKTESTYEVVSADRDSTVLNIMDKEVNREYKTRQIRDKNFNIVEAGNLRYTPSMDLLRMPLQIGKRKYSIERLQMDSGRVIKMEGVVEVFPMEKVTTPAGEFIACEIKADGRYIDPKVHKSSRYQSKVWFAPSIGFFVKQEHYERNVADNADAKRMKLELISYDIQEK